MDQQLNPITVDAIIEEADELLLIRRGNPPFKGELALPGGFVDYGETVEEAVIREVNEEVGIDAIPVTILGVYSGPKRDPRGPIISTVFVCRSSGKPEAGDDAASIEWINLNELGKMQLAFDHDQIISDYVDWKRTNSTYWSGKLRE